MRKHYRLTGLIATGGVMALALAGCAADGGDGGDDDAPGIGSEATVEADNNPQPRENLQEGGELVLPIAEIPAQLNAHQTDASAYSARLWNWYNPQVILMTPEGEPYANPAYVLEWDHDEVVDGNSVVRFVLNPEAKFNDGTPIDYRAFQAAWTANRSNEEGYQPNATDGWEQVASVEAGEDDFEVIVTFDGEFAYPEMLFSNILHPDVDTPEKFNEAYLNEMNPDWGAGPYKVDSFDTKGGTVILTPNENWWGDAPLLDKVTFRQLEPVAALNAFKNGEVDYVETGNADRLAQVEDMEGVTTYRALQTANGLLILDAENPLLADLDVRQAIFEAIDREQVKEVVWNGLDYEEPDAGSFTLFSFQDGYVDALKNAGYEYNPDNASELLEGAGWELNDEGIREKDGETLSITFPIHGDDPLTEARTKVIQQQLKAVGVDMEIDVRPLAQFSEDFNTKNWDIFMLAFTSSDPFGAAWFNQLYASDSGLNLSSTGTPEIDEKIADLQTITDGDELTEAAMELEAEVFSETWGIFPMYNGPFIATAKDGLANMTPEEYTGLDLFGRSPVENVGWEK
ncbi:ABC transporter family substrate-binding protein [Microbacterium sp. gxy059]|uniref:ABC transporter family substrate-binding protein n=1 Tax=Microbacterium sp. gxy059 TaxID=2957199 RepID=UPI003D957638